MKETDFPYAVSVTEASRLAQANPEKVRILDVREPHEVAICSVDGAESIPMQEIPARLASLPRDRHLLVLCHHGGRSLRVCQYLRAQGFPAVTNITGGIDAWAREIDPRLTRY